MGDWVPKRVRAKLRRPCAACGGLERELSRSRGPPWASTNSRATNVRANECAAPPTRVVALAVVSTVSARAIVCAASRAGAPPPRGCEGSSAPRGRVERPCRGCSAGTRAQGCRGRRCRLQFAGRCAPASRWTSSRRRRRRAAARCSEGTCLATPRAHRPRHSRRWSRSRPPRSALDEARAFMSGRARAFNRISLADARSTTGR